MSTSCPSTFQLERHLGGEEWPGAEALATHVSGCEACQASLAQLERVGRAYRESPEALRLKELLAGPRVRAGASPSPRRAQRWLLGVSGAAAVAALVVLLVVPTPSSLTAKGDGLSFVLQRAGGQVLWDERSALEAGDVLQPMWAGQDAVYVALIARLAGGETEVVFPRAGEDAALVPAGAPARLGGSIVIDEQARSSELWLFVSRRPFALGSIREGVGRGAAATSFEGRTVWVALPQGPRR